MTSASASTPTAGHPNRSIEHSTFAQRDGLPQQARDQLLKTEQVLATGLAYRSRLLDRYRFGYMPDRFQALQARFIDDCQVNLAIQVTVYLDLVYASQHHCPEICLL